MTGESRGTGSGRGVGAEPGSDADRAAIEAIRGRPLARVWPEGALAAGTRVTVVRDREWGGPWRAEFRGVVDAMGAPEPVTDSRAEEGELAYWVAFDEPQYDSDGGGPYRKALVRARYLRPLR
ncbi:ferrous iron transport protein A [Kitasatospora sp. NPDC088391]|uniref:ferrous iron transport protein A n=1 Tax=Kitasatospora sp. NPDC088391 TaxID=3364074 RepID=UPI0038074529